MLVEKREWTRQKWEAKRTWLLRAMREGQLGRHACEEGKRRNAQVMVVIVNLDGRELSLVDDVLVGERTNVESAREEEGVGGVLAEDVKLALKVLFVEGGVRVGDLAVSVRGGEHDDGLEDVGLAGEGCGTEDRAVRRDLAPSENAKVERLGDLLERRLVRDEEVGAALLEEDVSDGVLALVGELDVQLALRFAHEEGVGDADHDSCSISVT